MKESIHNFLVCLIIILIVVIFLVGLALSINNSSKQKEEVCKKIETKTGLEYYSWSHTPCGWGKDCHYVCKFLDENGEIVLKQIK